jgi:hypothetical protein
MDIYIHLLNALTVDALADIPGISYALDLFLASHMLESEDYCNKSDEHKLSSIPFFLT